MVTNTGEADGLRPLRFLNQPRRVQVEADAQGQPCRVVLRGRWQPVEGVRDVWRIDDEWWREQPIHRIYYEVILNEGAVTTLFHDVPNGEWADGERAGGEWPNGEWPHGEWPNGGWPDGEWYEQRG